MTTWIGVGVAVLVVMLIVNKQAVARMFGAGRAQVGKLGRAAEEADPLALLNQAVDDGVNTIQHAKQGLEKARALVLSVQRQVEAGRKTKAQLENRIQAAMDAGDPNHTASDYALQLAQTEKDLAVNEEQLKHHQESYENALKQIQVGQKRVVETRQKAQRLGVQLEMSERAKEMYEWTQNFDFDPNKMNEGVARAEELVQRRIDENNAKGDVSNALNSQALAQAADDDLERQAEAAKILERFKKPATT